MTCHIGDGIIVCTTGDRWRVEPSAYCPWCKEQRRCLSALVFSGWCGSDFKCGTCGSFWSSDEGYVRNMTEDERDKNIAEVAARQDPKCWDCHDSGWTGGSPIDMEYPCSCPAGIAAAAAAPPLPAVEEDEPHEP